MRVTVVCNPQAGRGRSGDALRPALEVLRKAGWTVRLCNTNGPGDAIRLAREAVAEGHDAVLVAGGDGTINEAVQALAGTETALGYLPYGTVNVWAREMGIPLDAVGAAEALVGGKRERIDLGIASGRYFLLMAGVGFDAEVLKRSRRVERYKHRFGVLPYVATGVFTAPLYRGADIELRYDGIIRRVHALMVVIGNTRLYGGYFRLTPNAIANDGWLDLCIVKGGGPFDLVRQSLPVLIMRSIKHSDVEMIRVRSVSLVADVPLACQLDGEVYGTTPLEVSVAARALYAIVPDALASNLIA